MSDAPAPLSVACVSVSAALGGSEWVLLDFATRAAALGVSATVVLPKPGPLGDALRAAGVAATIAPADEELLAASQRAMLSFAGVTRFARGIARWSQAIGKAVAPLASGGRRPVLYSNGFKAHLACAPLRAHPRVWHLHEFPPERIALIWRSLAAALPDARIANSEAVAGAWTWGRARPVVVVNGVDLDRFRPGPRTFWIHDQLGLAHDARLIGMPAVFARWKGHLHVVEAFERAAGRLEDAHLVLVGGPIYDTTAETGYAEELVRRVRRSSASGARTTESLAGRIHFLKFHPEPWRLYPEFDVVVHFSTRPEPFGRVITEAMASGVPVIAADAGGPREIVEDGVTGWRVPPGDVPALSERMVTALETDTGPMRAAARRAAQARYSAERFAREVADVLRRAAP